MAPALLGGRARALATTARQRLPVLSAIETFAENGLDGLGGETILALLHGAAGGSTGAWREALRRGWPAIAAALRAAGIEPAPSPA